MDAMARKPYKTDLTDEQSEPVKLNETVGDCN